MQVRGCSVLLATVFAISCVSCAQLGLPRTSLSIPSPNGSSTALVRNHPGIDPPNQSLWLKNASGEKRLRDLTPDVDWCSEIAWSADSREVAFLIRDVHVLVFGADGVLRDEVDLVKRSGNYLERFAAHNIEMTQGQLRFSLCERTEDYRSLKEQGCPRADVAVR